MEVDVIRSRKRRKTVEAHIVEGRMRLAIPAWMSKSEERHWVEVMTKRLRPHRDAAALDLTGRTNALADRYGLPQPEHIRFVDNQHQRWGSCTPDDSTIRISSRLARFPPWVLDYVIVHELAHLVELSHNAAFHALVDRYPKAERARGFLIAKSHGDDAPDDTDAAARTLDLVADPDTVAPDVARQLFDGIA